MCFFLAQAAFSQEPAQDTSKTRQLSLVVKNDGSEYIGVILSDDGREILIETQALGKIYILKSDISRISKIENESDIIYGEFREEGPFTTRYAFTTNALAIKKGENYALVNLYGPEVHFALSDRFSLGVMTTWIVSPLVLAAKYSVKTKNEKINLSIGSLFGTSGYLNSFASFGGLYFGNITIGSRSKNITFSGGYAHINIEPNTVLPAATTVYSNNPYYENSFDRNNTRGPIFSVAGIVKVGAKASFVFDSMIGVFGQQRIGVNTTTITEPNYDVFPSTPGYYRHDVEPYTKRYTALFVMPGMRFQKTEKSAFQISLVGVSVFRWLSKYENSNNFSFPIPTVMWFFKF